MSVPKSKRKESRFEAQHNLYILRKEVTNLVVADFGFSEEKYLEQMERYRAAHRSAENVDEVCARWQVHGRHRHYPPRQARAAGHRGGYMQDRRCARAVHQPEKDQDRQADADDQVSANQVYADGHRARNPADQPKKRDTRT